MMFIPVFQLDAITPTDAAAPLSFDPVSILTNPIAIGVYVLFGFVLIGIIAALFSRSSIRKSTGAKTAFDLKVLLVRVPKLLKPEDAQGDECEHHRRNALDEEHPAPDGDAERRRHRQQPP